MSRDSEILRAAAELFLEHGYAKVRVDDIGARAGISGPAIYHHFGSKDEILATLFDQAMDHLLLLVGPTRDGDPHEQLRALLVAQAEFAVTDRVLVSVYAREGRSLIEPWRRQHLRRHREHVQRWTDTLQRCYPERTEDELLSTAHGVIGLSLSVAQWPERALATENLQELMIDLMTGAVESLARSDCH